MKLKIILLGILFFLFAVVLLIKFYPIEILHFVVKIIWLIRKTLEFVMPSLKV